MEAVRPRRRRFPCREREQGRALGSVLHSLDASLEVLVFPRLNTLPFDGLEPSREIAGRRSSVLRRLAKRKKPVFLVSTAEAVMERLPLPASWGRLSISLKVARAIPSRISRIAWRRSDTISTKRRIIPGAFCSTA